MKELRTAVEIDATPARVWEILTDFEAYPDWNPFIRRITGEPELGARLEVRIEPPGGRGMTFKPTVLELEPERVLRWLGRVLVPGILDGEHELRLEPAIDNRVPLPSVGALQWCLRAAVREDARADEARLRRDERGAQGQSRGVSKSAPPVRRHSAESVSTIVRLARRDPGETNWVADTSSDELSVTRMWMCPGRPPSGRGTGPTNRNAPVPSVTTLARPRRT